MEEYVALALDLEPDALREWQSLWSFEGPVPHCVARAAKAQNGPGLGWSNWNTGCKASCLVSLCLGFPVNTNNYSVVITVLCAKLVSH